MLGHTTNVNVFVCKGLKIGKGLREMHPSFANNNTCISEILLMPMISSGDQCFINRDFALGISNPLNPNDQFAAF